MKLLKLEVGKTIIKRKRKRPDNWQYRRGERLLQALRAL